MQISVCLKNVAKNYCRGQCLVQCQAKDEQNSNVLQCICQEIENKKLHVEITNVIVGRIVLIALTIQIISEEYYQARKYVNFGHNPLNISLRYKS